MFQKYEDEKIFYIENNDQSLTNCSELKYSPRSNPDCEDYSALFDKIPYLRKLNFDFPWFHKSQIPLRLFPEVVSQCQYLTNLTYSIPDDKTLDAFVQFVEKSPKILEVLTLQFSLDGIIAKDWFNMIGEALRFLPKLKSFAIIDTHDMGFPWWDLDSQEDLAQDQSFFLNRHSNITRTNEMDEFEGLANDKIVGKRDSQMWQIDNEKGGEQMLVVIED